MTKSLRERWKQESSQMVPKDPSKDTKKSFEIFKTDEDQRLVFGWASVAINVAGETLEDRQHDMIDPEDLEEAAYEYVLNFRDTGEEHLPGYRKKGKLVESCVFTPEKQRAMGIPEGTLPVAWWIGFKIDDDDTWARIKNGTYRMFSIEGKAEREEVRKAESTARTFDDVLKFNPFHDRIGRFSTAQGMNSYSANPKTRAGQLAIGRSAPNHGQVPNIHRESKGENIAQNQDWIMTGKKPKVADEWDALHPPKKPKYNVNDQKDTSQAQPQSQGGALAESVKDVKLSAKDKLALQARDWNGNPTETKQVAGDHYQPIVEGKDITKSFDYEDVVFDSHKEPIDALAEAQGWNKASTVTTDRDLFDKACLQSGVVLCRSVYGTLYGEKKTAEQVCKDTMTDGDSPLGGTGGKAYGSGMYMTNNKLGGSGMDLADEVKLCQGDSWPYGDTQMMATVHPKAKIADAGTANRLAAQWYDLSQKERDRFGNDRNAYIAAHGYDGAKWGSDMDPGAYCTIFNKSALIFYGGVAKNH